METHKTPNLGHSFLIYKYKYPFSEKDNSTTASYANNIQCASKSDPDSMTKSLKLCTDNLLWWFRWKHIKVNIDKTVSISNANFNMKKS